MEMTKWCDDLIESIADPGPAAEDETRPLAYRQASFDCLEQHLGLAMAMGNYWRYVYAKYLKNQDKSLPGMDAKA